MSLVDSSDAVDTAAECKISGVVIESAKTFFKREGHQLRVRRITPREEDDGYFLPPEDEPKELRFE